MAKPFRRLAILKLKEASVPASNSCAASPTIMSTPVVGSIIEQRICCHSHVRLTHGVARAAMEIPKRKICKANIRDLLVRPLHFQWNPDAKGDLAVQL